MHPQTSPAGLADEAGIDRGFSLIEVVCALAILGLLASIMLPAFPGGTSRTRLEAFAVETASLLKMDRDAAIRQRKEIVTHIDLAMRSVRSGATGRIVRVPEDVVFNALLAQRCNQRAAGSAIWFFPTGTSCGGVVSLSRLGAVFEVRVNWLTGGVELVGSTRS